MDIVGMLIGGAAVGGAWLIKDVLVPAWQARHAQRLASSAQVEAEQRAAAREDDPVKTRIIARVTELVESMERVYVRGEFSYDEWQGRHDRIEQLVESNDGARALGQDLYLLVMQAINYDQLAINIARRNRVEHDAAEAAAGGTGRARVATRDHDAFVLQVVATSATRLVEILQALGIADAEQRFGHSARQALARAENLMSLPPSL